MELQLNLFTLLAGVLQWMSLAFQERKFFAVRDRHTVRHTYGILAPWAMTASSFTQSLL